MSQPIRVGPNLQDSQVKQIIETIFDEIRDRAIENGKRRVVNFFERMIMENETVMKYSRKQQAYHCRVLATRLSYLRTEQYDHRMFSGFLNKTHCALGWAAEWKIGGLNFNSDHLGLPYLGSRPPYEAATQVFGKGSYEEIFCVDAVGKNQLVGVCTKLFDRAERLENSTLLNVIKRKFLSLKMRMLT